MAGVGVYFTPCRVSDKTEQRSAAAVNPMLDFGLIERVELGSGGVFVFAGWRWRVCS